jgi:hypothetical protein
MFVTCVHVLCIHCWGRCRCNGACKYFPNICRQKHKYMQVAILKQKLEGHKSVVWGTAISADSLIIASCGVDKTIRLCHYDTGQHICTL